MSQRSFSAKALLMGAAFGLTIAFSAAQASFADTAALEAFGGKPGLDRVASDFVDALVKDPQIGSFFSSAEPKRLKAMLADQFCEELSGPCKYTGVDMKTIHSSFDIRMEHFNRLVEVLQDAMDKNNVPFSAQNKLLEQLAPMYKDMINNGDAKKK
jgi:hemoglobin